MPKGVAKVSRKQEVSRKRIVFRDLLGVSLYRNVRNDLLHQKARARVKAAKRRGVKFGQKLKLSSEQIDHARKLIDKGEARQYVADLLNVGRSTLYRSYRALSDVR
jgi:Helix-turn-helix domain of resolvase